VGFLRRLQPSRKNVSNSDGFRHVEVQATTGSRDSVLLSANERRYADDPEKYSGAFLFVVESIGLKTRGGELRAVGGRGEVRRTVPCRGGSVAPTQFRYRSEARAPVMAEHESRNRIAVSVRGSALPRVGNDRQPARLRHLWVERIS
jgi:hypothetical protein